MAPRWGLAAVAILACIACVRRPALRPIALVLAVLACLNFARHYAHPSPSFDALLWCAWPFVPAVLAWRAWVGEWKWTVYASAALALTCAATWHLTTPHVVAPLLACLAWSSRTLPRSPAQTVAALLAWSGVVDVVAGALSPGGTWALAAPLAWATWAAVGVVVGWECYRERARS